MTDDVEHYLETEDSIAGRTYRALTDICQLHWSDYERGLPEDRQ